MSYQFSLYCLESIRFNFISIDSGFRVPRCRFQIFRSAQHPGLPLIPSGIACHTNPSTSWFFPEGPPQTRLALFLPDGSSFQFALLHPTDLSVGLAVPRRSETFEEGIASERGLRRAIANKSRHLEATKIKLLPGPEHRSVWIDPPEETQPARFDSLTKLPHRAISEGMRHLVIPVYKMRMRPETQHGSKIYTHQA